MNISIQDLNKVYPNGNHALKDVNIEINDGMFGLLGPNGAGKSSLMRILVTLMKPSSGRVLVNGKDTAKNRDYVRSMLGYLPQDFSFFSNLKTYEFLDYAARLSGMSSGKKRRAAVDKMLEEVALFDVRNIVADISSTCDHMALLNRGQVAFTGSPEEIIRQAEGHVWSLNVDEKEYVEVNQKYQVIATVMQKDGWKVTVVGDEVLGYDAEPESPNLEHAYVYFVEHTLKNQILV